ncbi:MAG: GNAT family N-acetyltransferase, partial [Saprospiraceae bacterium]
YYQGLSSQRFFYRKMTYNDTFSWMEFYYDNPNLKYLGFDLNRPIEVMAKAWIEAQKERYENNAFGQLGIISKANNDLVGSMGFKISAYCDEGEIEKMTGIKPAYWRQGVGKEASIAMINAVFENDLAKSIIGTRHIDNDSSRKYTQNLGFEDLEIIETSTRQIVKYRLTKTAWEQKRDSGYFEGKRSFEKSITYF